METVLPYIQNPPPLTWPFAFVIGLIFGSFFNVLIYRIPRGESLVWPGSHCTRCKNLIVPYDNIPLLSYYMLGGHCRNCKQRIPFRYPLVEFLTGVATVSLVFWFTRAGLGHWVLVEHAVVLVIFLLFIPIVFIDLSHRLIPDVFTIPFLAAGLLVSLVPGGQTPLQSVFGMLAGGVPLLAIGWFGEKVFKKGEAMGGGDIKLMAGLGALLGPTAILLSLFLGSVFGSVGGIITLLTRKDKGDRKIAFGPYLCLGTVGAYFAGRHILQAYWWVVEWVIS